MPRRTLLSEKVLVEAGVLGEVTTGEYELYFQSLAQDLLSLELDDAFADLYLVCSTSTARKHPPDEEIRS